MFLMNAQEHSTNKVEITYHNIASKTFVLADVLIISASKHIAAIVKIMVRFQKFCQLAKCLLSIAWCTVQISLL